MLYLYRVSQLEDFEFLLELKSQKDAIKWSGFSTAPNRENFLRYFQERVLGNPNVFMYYLKDTTDEIPMGYIQFDKVTEAEAEGRGTNILKKYQGCGLLEEMTQLMFQELKKNGFKSMFTYCSELNKASILNLKYNGYVQTEEFEIRKMEGQDSEHKFYKWIKEIK